MSRVTRVAIAIGADALLLALLELLGGLWWVNVVLQRYLINELDFDIGPGILTAGFLMLVPFVAIPAIVFVLLTSLFGPDAVRRRRGEQGLCQHCGYNLTGNVSGVCPECGENV